MDVSLRLRTGAPLRPAGAWRVALDEKTQRDAWSGWHDAVEAGAILVIGSAATLALRQALLQVFTATPISALVDPEFAPGLRFADFPWPDCIALVLGLVVLPVVYERFVRGTRLSEIGFRLGRRMHLLIGGGLAAGAGLALWAMLVSRILRLHRPRLTTPEDAGNLALFALVWLTIAVSEEVFFRGMLQRRLARAVGPATAILAVAAVFAFAGHVRADPLIGLAIRLPGGLLLGYLYHHTRSLLPSSAAHWAFNLLL